MPDGSVDLILTDPPYPINTNKGTNRFTENGWFEGSQDNLKDDWYLNFEKILKEYKRILKEGKHFYCFVDEKNLFKLKPYLDKYFNFKKVIVWHKKNFGLGYHYRNVIEYCFLYSKGKSKIHIKDQPNFFKDTKDNIDGHPTVKPKKMFKWLIENSTKENDIVLDNYIGSGTTAIAAELSNRKFIGYEINRHFYKLSIKRLSKFRKEYLDFLDEEEKPDQLQMF